MKNFYLHENGQLLGPFSVDDLKRRSVTISTPIWKEGMAAWTNAGQLDELSQLFRIQAPARSSIPPGNYPPQSNLKKEEGQLRMRRIFGWIGLLATIVIIVSFVVYKNQQAEIQDPKPKTPEELRAEFLHNEQSNPAAHISGSYKNREQLLRQRLIQLDLNNNATLANFKDVVVNVTYLSNTGTTLKTQRVVISEQINAGQSVQTKLKAEAPSATKDIRIAVESAVAVQ